MIFIPNEENQAELDEEDKTRVEELKTLITDYKSFKPYKHEIFNLICKYLDRSPIL